VQNKMLDETTCEVLLENMVHACWGPSSPPKVL
jgi:hypothetical protein